MVAPSKIIRKGPSKNLDDLNKFYANRKEMKIGIEVAKEFWRKLRTQAENIEEEMNKLIELEAISSEQEMETKCLLREAWESLPQV